MTPVPSCQRTSDNQDSWVLDLSMSPSHIYHFNIIIILDFYTTNSLQAVLRAVYYILKLYKISSYYYHK